MVDKIDKLMEYLKDKEFVNTKQVSEILGVGRRKAAYVLRTLGWERWASQHDKTTYRKVK